jgi:hypothetical protein
MKPRFTAPSTVGPIKQDVLVAFNNPVTRRAVVGVVEIWTLGAWNHQKDKLKAK